MAYQDYDWQTQDAPWFWRIAELYARIAIGSAWALALFSALYLLIDAPWSTWTTVAFIAVFYYGIDLAMPQRRFDES